MREAQQQTTKFVSFYDTDPGPLECTGHRAHALWCGVSPALLVCCDRRAAQAGLQSEVVLGPSEEAAGGAKGFWA